MSGFFSIQHYNHSIGFHEKQTEKKGGNDNLKKRGQVIRKVEKKAEKRGIMIGGKGLFLC